MHQVRPFLNNLLTWAASMTHLLDLPMTFHPCLSSSAAPSHLPTPAAYRELAHGRMSLRSGSDCRQLLDVASLVLGSCPCIAPQRRMWARRRTPSGRKSQSRAATWRRASILTWSVSTVAPLQPWLLLGLSAKSSFALLAAPAWLTTVATGKVSGR